MTTTCFRIKRRTKSQHRLTYKSKVVFFFVFSMFLFSIITGQKNEIDNDRLEGWVDIKSSPLKFAVSENRRFGQLVNHSDATIIGFSLGCVRTNNGIHSAVKSVAYIKSTILGNEGENKSFYFADLSLFEKYKSECKAEKSRLGVYEINFTDGSVWRLNGFKAKSKSE